ncbi:hypothetical protein BDZ97DRAFT_1920297 [Flammula alnicola]|nr:hypothetical protein BDZ97DRAFT_1920297 [Flammula alnicola]
MSSSSDIFTDPALKPKLDPSLYSLRADELAFFKSLTGIRDEEEVKAHIMDVQAKARFSFTRLKIARLPGYKEALKLLNERNDPILLDIGCCFGNDARKAVVDGWPVQNVIASDYDKTFPAAFIAGDVFDPATVAPRGAFITESEISAIHASSFFHLFSEERQLVLAQRLASLLSPMKGSVIFGQHIANPVKGFRTEATWKASAPTAPSPGSEVSQHGMFCHSPESWKKMWFEDVFAGEDGKGEDRVKVDAELTEVIGRDLLGRASISDKAQFWLLNWCVTKL